MEAARARRLAGRSRVQKCRRLRRIVTLDIAISARYEDQIQSSLTAHLFADAPAG